MQSTSGMKLLNSNRRQNLGVTLIEIIVGVALFSFICAFALRGFQYAAKTLGLQEKLELSTRLRNASAVLSKDLGFATAILLPNKVTTDFHSLLVFRNFRNEVVAVFCSEEGLIRYNFSRKKTYNIFPLASGFSCRLNQNNLVEYRLDVASEKLTFSLANQLTPYQTLP